MPTEYFDDTTLCPKCGTWISLDRPDDPGPENCPKCGCKLREKGENPRKGKKPLPPQ